MKRTLCKIACYILLFAMIATTFVGCARESDEEFLTIAQTLLLKSADVNEICFGEGLAYGDEDGYVTNGYVEATKASRERYGVNTVEELKELIKSVYSVATCDYIDTVIFNPVKQDNTFASYRRYFDALDGEENICLMVKKNYQPLAVGDVSYANVRIDSHSRARAKILTDVTVTDGKDTRTDLDVCFSLRFEDGAWKLDTVTYASLK